jgi:hypothetical protein
MTRRARLSKKDRRPMNAAAGWLAAPPAFDALAWIA